MSQRIGQFEIRAKSLNLNCKYEKDTIYEDPDCFHFRATGRLQNHQELAREIAVAKATIYNWKSKYGGIEASDVKKLNEFEEENSSLKKMYPVVAMDNQILKDLFSKKGWALPQKGS